MTEQLANLAQTTLAKAIGVVSQGTIEAILVSTGARFPTEGNFRINLGGGELGLVTSTSGSNWTVTRGIEGSIPIAHPIGQVITGVLTAGALREAFDTKGSASTAQGAAETAATTAVGAEAVARASADTNLATSIGNEKTARETAVSAAITTAEAASDAAGTATAAVAGEKTRAETAEGSKLAKGENLKDISNAATARTNLGLGTAAVESASAFDAKGAAASAQSSAESKSDVKGAAAAAQANAETASIPTTALNTASGAAKLGTDSTVGGPGGSPLTSSVVNDSRGSANGDLLLFSGGTFVKLPRGEPGQQMIVRSDNTIAYIPLPEVHLSAWTKKGPTEDCTADFNTARAVADERGAVLVVTGERTLTGTVEALNPSSKEWAMRGGGNGAVIVDKNTTGPCLRFKLTGENKHGVINWRDFTIKTLAEKPSQNVVEWLGLKTAQFRCTNVVWEDELETVHLFKSALYLENITEGKFDGCKWRFLRGHDFWITNPTGYNGGNIEFSSCQSQECRNGGYIDGQETTNNVLFNNFKWTGNTTSTSKHFYEERKTSLPVIGAKEIQLATGLEASYFPPNAAVALYSFAGMEVVHAAATAEPYNPTTGILTLRDEVTKEHTGHTDMRVMCSRWSIVTGFFTPNLTFLNCHQEARPALHVDGSGNYINCEISADRLKTNSLPVKLVTIAGKSGAGEWRFSNPTFQHVNGEEAEYDMVHGLCAAGATEALASVDIDGVTTFPGGQASQEKVLFRPLGWDGLFGTFARRKVRTSNHGVELNTFPGDSSFHSVKVLTGATASAPQSGDIIPCEAPAGSNQETTLSPIPNKTYTFIRVGSSTHNIILKTGVSGGKFVDGATESETFELTSTVPRITVTYESETKKWYVAAKG